MASSISSTAKSTHPPHSIHFYIGLGLMGQLVWGSYPVAAKRAIAEVPKFSLLLVATLAAMGIGVWMMYRDGARSWRQVVRFLGHEKALWGLAIFVVLRSVTNILAIDFTRATWVQLIYLLTPFLVAILGSWFFGEQTPRYTYRALMLSTLGAALVLVADWRDVLGGFSTRDLLGLGLALGSMLALAFYYQMIRRSSRNRASNGMILFQQSMAMVGTYLVLTVVTGEDWGRWLALSANGWGYVLWVVIGVFILGNLWQIAAISGASPALITSLMPLRLLSAISLGWLILGERLTTVWQWLGAGLVLVTVSGYLWLQGRDSFRTAL
ncbi:MAG TPA: DMT family transporter [Anaerolineae bacterium]|nr:DMT family transporter [Anaerolineae bacterium]